MTDAKNEQRDDLAAKDRRIDDLIAEAEANLAALMAVVDEMKRQSTAQKQQSKDDRG